MKDKTIVSHFSYPIRGTVTALYTCIRLRTLLNASAHITPRNVVEGTEDAHKTLFVSRLEDPLHCQLKPCLRSANSPQFFSTEQHSPNIVTQIHAPPEQGARNERRKLAKKVKTRQEVFSPGFAHLGFVESCGTTTAEITEVPHTPFLSFVGGRGHR